MCTDTVKQYTNSRYISTVHASKFSLRFPCCNCAECQRQKQSEWSLRAYYQAKETFDKGGFVLFDSLTYRDANLKWFTDVYPEYAFIRYGNFMSFSREDVKKFFKLLRIRLKRAGFMIDGNLKYLLTSEYGSRPDCTHRPHYHILFFVTFPINPLQLSKFISECWPHGKTDGIAPSGCTEPWLYKHPLYVLNKRVFQGNVGDLLRVANYVTKYISKDMHLHKSLMKRVVYFFSCNNPHWTKDYKERLKFRRFKNQCMPFHLCSKGFGLYAIKITKLDEILRYNALTKPLTSSAVVASVPLPMYYKRKLFYQYFWFNGSLKWNLKPEYKEYRKKILQVQIDNFSARLKSWDPNIPYEELSKYWFLRAGVLMPRFMVGYSDSQMVDSLVDVPNYKELLYNDRLLFGNSGECKFYQGKLIGEKYLPSDQKLDIYNHGLCYPAYEFEVKPFDSSLVVYHNKEYDVILNQFFDYQKDIGEKLDKVADHSDDLRDQMKSAGLVEC